MEIPLILFYVGVTHYYGKQVGLMTLTVILIALIIVEFVRLESGLRVPMIIENMFRMNEKDKIGSMVFFVLSTIVVLSVFDLRIAIVSLLLATVGDTVSAFLGKAFGKRKIYRNKTWFGTISGMIANIAIGVVLLPDYIIIAVVMGVAASATEALSTRIDDNLTVPIFAGFIGQLMLESDRFFPLPF
jgi:dolichol kinase